MRPYFPHGVPQDRGSEPIRGERQHTERRLRRRQHRAQLGRGQLQPARIDAESPADRRLEIAVAAAAPVWRAFFFSI